MSSKLNQTPDKSSVFANWGGFSRYQGSRSGQSQQNFSAQRWLDQSALGASSFKDALNSRDQAGLASLAQERDPELFFSGLLVLAQQFESQKKPELAAPIYGAIARDAVNLGSPAILDTAEQRLLALRGEGGFGPQAESLIRGFKDSATDYRTIVPMLAGTLVGQVAKTATITRLLGAGEAGFLTRTAGTEVLGGAIGFGAESLTFAVAGRALSHPPSRSWGQDLASSAISLGALKLSGGIAAKANLNSGIGRYGSLYLGMLAAHRLESELDLRPKTTGWAMLGETFAGLLSMEVGAHLGHRALGPKWAAFQQEIGARLLASRERGGSPVNPFLQAWLPATASHSRPQVFLSEINRPKIPTVLMMSELKPGDTNQAGGSATSLDAKEFPFTHRSEDDLVGVRLVTELVSAKPMHNMDALAARLKQSLMDILWEGKEGFIKLKGPIAEEMRNSEALRSELVGNYSQSEIRIDVSSGRIISLRFFDGERVVKTITEESLGATPGPVPAPIVAAPIAPAAPLAPPPATLPDEALPPVPASIPALIGPDVPATDPAPAQTAAKPIVETHKDRATRIGTHQLAPLQNRIYEIFTALPQEEMTFGEIRRLYDSKYPHLFAGDSGVRGSLDRLVEKKLIELRITDKKGATGSNYFYKLAKEVKPPAEAVVTSAEAPPPAIIAAIAPAAPVDAESNETPKAATNPKLPPRMTHYTAKDFALEIIRNAKEAITPQQAVAALESEYGVSLSVITMRARLRELESEGKLESRPLDPTKGTVSANVFWLKKTVGDGDASTPAVPTVTPEPESLEPSAAPEPVQTSKLPPHMIDYTAKQFAMNILEVSGQEMTPQEVVDDLQARYQVTLSVITVRGSLREMESEGKLESRPFDTNRGGAPAKKYWIKKPGGGDGGNQGGSTPSVSGEPGPAAPAPATPTPAMAPVVVAPVSVPTGGVAPVVTELKPAEPISETPAVEERVIDLNQGWRDLQNGVRLFGIPQANQQGLPSYQINVLFPGLMHLVFGANFHPDGNIFVSEQPASKVTDFSTRQRTPASVDKISEFRSRVAITMARGGKTIPLDIAPVLGPNNSILRIGAATNQAIEPEAWRPLFSSTSVNARQPVLYLHHEQLSNTIKAYGQGARFQKFQIFLSNGDVVEFEAKVRHHNQGSMEVQYAQLRRFGAPSEEVHELKFATSRKNREVRVELKGEQYRIQFLVTLSDPHGQGETQISHVQVLQHPAPAHLKPAESADSIVPSSGQTIFDLENQALGGSREALNALGELAQSDLRAVQALRDLSDIVSDTGEESIGELKPSEFLELVNSFLVRATAEGPVSGANSSPSSLPRPSSAPKSVPGAGGPTSGNSERIRRWVEQSKNRNWRELIRGSVFNHVNRTKSDLNAAEAQMLILEFSAALLKIEGTSKDLRYHLGLYQSIEALRPLVDASIAATVETRLKSQETLIHQLNQVWNRSRSEPSEAIPAARSSSPGPLLPRIEGESPAISTTKSLVEFAARAETEARRVQFRRQADESLKRLSPQERYRLAEEMIPRIAEKIGVPAESEPHVKLLTDVLASLVHGFDPSQREPLIEKIPPLWRDRVKERFPN